MAAKTDKPTEKKDWREVFIANLRKEPNVTRAARLSRVNRQYLYEIRAEEPEFAKAWDDALGQAMDSAESEVYRRAVKGTIKPVFQNGKKVGAIREYSDTLLMFMLKAHKPEKYRDQLKLSGDGPEGEILIKIDR